MPTPEIKTPKGSIVVTPNMSARLTWNVNFRPKWHKRYTQAQKFVDSEVLRYSEPYIPLRTGMLIKSGILGTEVGSGKVQWIAIYARRQYYLHRRVGSETGALRGSFWFERMKKDKGLLILKGARRIAAGEGRILPI